MNDKNMNPNRRNKIRHGGVVGVIFVMLVALALMLGSIGAFATGHIVKTGTNDTKTTGGNSFFDTNPDSTTSTFAKGMKLTSVTVVIDKLKQTPRATIVNANFDGDDTGIVWYKGDDGTGVKSSDKGNAIKNGGTCFYYLYKDAAILPDRTTADVMITYSDVNLYVSSTFDNTNPATPGGQVEVAKGTNMHAGIRNNTGTTKWYVGVEETATVTVVKNGSSVEGEILYSMWGANVDRDVTRTSDTSPTGYDGNYGRIPRPTDSQGNSHDSFGWAEQIELNPSSLADDIFMPERGTILNRNNTSEAYGQTYSGTYLAHQKNNGSDLVIHAYYTNPYYTNPAGANYSYLTGFATSAPSDTGMSVTFRVGTGWNGSSQGIDNKLYPDNSFILGIDSSTTPGGNIQTTRAGNSSGDLVLVDSDDAVYEPGFYSVPYDKTVTYTMTQKPGYKLHKVIVDGKEVNVKSTEKTNSEGLKYYTYTFEEIKEDHVIHVAWKPITASVEASKVWNDFNNGFQSRNEVVPLYMHLLSESEDDRGVTQKYPADYYLPSQKIDSTNDGESVIWGKDNEGFTSADGVRYTGYDESAYLPGTKESYVGPARDHDTLYWRDEFFYDYDYKTKKFSQYKYNASKDSYELVQAYDNLNYLPKYDENGARIEYEVSEDDIDFYSIEYDRTKEGDETDPDKAVFEYDVTNTLDPVATVGIKADKSIDGRSYKAGDEFKFVLAGENEAPMPVVPPAKIANSGKNTPDTVERNASITAGQVRATVDFGIIAVTKENLDETKYGYGRKVGDAEKANDAQRGFITTWIKDHGDGTKTVYSSSIPKDAHATFTAGELKYEDVTDVQKLKNIWKDESTNTFYNCAENIPATAISTSPISYTRATAEQKANLTWFDPNDSTHTYDPTTEEIPTTAVAYAVFGKASDEQKRSLHWSDNGNTYVYRMTGVTNEAVNTADIIVIYSFATDKEKAKALGSSALDSKWKSADKKTVYTTDNNIPDDAVGTLLDNTFTYHITENPQDSSNGDSAPVTNDKDVEIIKLYAVYDESNHRILVSAKDDQGDFVTGIDATATKAADLSTAKANLELVYFTNEYNSDGVWSPRAVKVLDGRPLERNQFEFYIKAIDTLANGDPASSTTPASEPREITASDTPTPGVTGGKQNHGTQEKDKLQDVAKTNANPKGTNDLNGPIAWDDIKYTQEDLKKTVTYNADPSADQKASGIRKATSEEQTKVISWTDETNKIVYGPIPDDAEATVTVDAHTETVTFAKATDAQRKAAMGGDPDKTLWKKDGYKYTYCMDDSKIPGEALGTFYLAERTFSYDLWEVIPTGTTGYTYDQTHRTVQVTIEDKLDGTISIKSVKVDGATVASDKPMTTFDNEYKAQGVVNIKAVKDMDDRDLGDDEFEFTVSAKTKGAPLPSTTTVKNKADGTIDFGSITFTHANLKANTSATLGKYDAVRTEEGYYEKDFIYEIIEKNTSGGGIIPDKKKITCVITVREDNKGNITVVAVNGNTDADTDLNTNFKVDKATGTADNPSKSTVTVGKFTNKYQANGMVTVDAGKALKGGTLNAGDFYFQMVDNKGNVVATTSNAADGKLSFNQAYDLDKLHADKDAGICTSEDTTEPDNGPWTYTYKLKELKTDNRGEEYIVYDSIGTGEGYEVKVIVTDNGKGVLNTEARYKDAKITDSNKPKFTNRVADGLNISVMKKWVDNDDQDGLRETEVKIRLLNEDGSRAKDTEGKDIPDITLDENNSWKELFKNIPAKDTEGQSLTYKVAELDGDTPKESGSVFGGDYTVSIEGNQTSGFIVTNTHAVETLTSIKATKVWDDDNDKLGLRDDVILHLFGKNKDGLIVYDGGTKKLEKGDTTVEWKNVPKRHYEDADLNWEITEEPLYGYATKVTGDAKDGFTVTNTIAEPVSKVTATKTWNDSNYPERPKEVTLELWRRVGDADEEKVDEKTVGIDQKWTAEWNDLPVVENTRTGEKENEERVESKDVTKYKNIEDENDIIDKEAYDAIDDDAEKARYEEIIVHETDTVTEEVDVTKEEPVLYTVKETDVPDGYTATVVATGAGEYDVVNAREMDMVSYKVKKVWNDNDDADGIRPDHITFKFIQNGKVVETAISDEDSEWSYLFEKYPKYDSDGKAYEYEVEEIVSDKYTVAYPEDWKVYTGDESSINSITNTHNTAATISVEATKVWKDEEGEVLPSQDKEVVFRLIQIVDGASKDMKDDKTIDAGASGAALTVEWTDLPTVVDGKDATYTVKEVPIDGYKTEVSDGKIEDNILKISVTNTKTETPQPVVVEKPKVTILDPKAKDGDMILDASKYETEEEAENAKDEALKKGGPEHSGYTFVGWAANQDEFGDWIVVAKYNEVTPPTPTDKTVVSFIDPQTGKILKYDITDDPDSVTAPDAPKHKNLVFKGWNLVVDAAGNYVYVAEYGCECSNGTPKDVDKSTVNTGDDNMVRTWLWVNLLAMAALVLIIAMRKRWLREQNAYKSKH